MKKMIYVLLAALVVTLSGCAGMTTFEMDPASLGVGGDAGFKQKTDFKDLPLEMQQAIMYGGGE